jgi:hypothetical protein
MPDLSAEDNKLVTLAKAARARVGAAEGAAVRDGTGRTYAGASVGLPSLHLSALQVATAQAVAAGATTIEAAAVVSALSEVDEASAAAVYDLNPAAQIYLAAPDGTLVGS